MSTINLAIECGNTGFWYGRIIGLLGTHARAQTKADLLSILRGEFGYHCAWLKQYGFSVEGTEPDNWIIMEEIQGINELGESGGEVALFEFDKREITPDFLEETIHKMRFNRMDLLDLCQGLDKEILENVPPEKERSIEDILQHICNAEEFYITRFGKEADELYELYLGRPVSEVDKLPVFSRLDEVRKAGIKTLRDLVPRKSNSIFQRSEYTNFPQENWTAHKIIRRFLEHEREHIYNIREYLGLPIRSTN